MSLGRLPQARQADPAARNGRCRYAGPGAARHLRAPAALPARRGGSPKSLREAPPPTAGGSWRQRERCSAASAGTKKRAFVSPQPTGILLHKSATRRAKHNQTQTKPEAGGKNQPNVHSLGDAASVGGDAGAAGGENSQGRISQPELLPQVGRQASSAQLQLCSLVSGPAGRVGGAAFWLAARKLGAPAARGSGSGSALGAAAGAGGPGARHGSSRLGEEWSAPRRGCQSPASRGGSFAPRSSGLGVQLRCPAVQSPGCWRAQGCTRRG